MVEEESIKDIFFSCFKCNRLCLYIATVLIRAHCMRWDKNVEKQQITSSYPGWIKSPHVVTLGILKISDLDSLTIFIGGGDSGVNFGHPKSEVFRNGGVFRSKLWSSQI